MDCVSEDVSVAAELVKFNGLILEMLEVVVVVHAHLLHRAYSNQPSEKPFVDEVVIVVAQIARVNPTLNLVILYGVCKFIQKIVQASSARQFESLNRLPPSSKDTHATLNYAKINAKVEFSFHMARLLDLLLHQQQSTNPRASQTKTKVMGAWDCWMGILWGA